MKKKILIITAQLKIGGQEKVARDIARYGDTEHYEYHYVVFGDQTGIYEQELSDLGCKIYHISSPKESHILYFRTLKNLIREHKYHAVHAHTMFSCGWPMLAAKQLGVPIRISHAHSALDDGKNLIKTAYEMLMRFIILTCATDLVACGEKAGVRLYGAHAFRTRGKLILNGIDTEHFRFDSDARQHIRTQLGVQDAFLLGHAGHLAPVKNQRFLLELMPAILKQEPRAKLCLLGEGSDRAMLEARIHDLGLESHVILTGNVLNVADYLSAMDVFVFPSLYEGTPLAILEVQANGLPCILSTGVPRDVHKTNLVHALPLDAPKEQWVDAILSCHRNNSAQYCLYMKKLGCSTIAAIKSIHHIYDGK